MSKKTIKIIGIGLGLGLLFIIGVATWVWFQFQSVNTSDTTKKRFVINKGQSVIKTGQTLKDAGLIKNATVFRIYARYKQLDTKMQAGSYEISPNMSLAAISERLTQGSEDIWVTLLEGWRVEEVAEYLATQDLQEFDAKAFIELASDSEGMIFPDTYLVPKESTSEQLYNLFINTFTKKVERGLEKEITADGRDLKKIIIFASLVEREARSYDDKRRVAGILQNRIDAGMPLQVDATLQYMRGYDKQGKGWWTPPTINLKDSTSPYNTYKFAGLPPGPISNPGLQAIKAVLDPLESDDLFYIHSPSGEMFYSRTLEEHNAYVNRYLR